MVPAPREQADAMRRSWFATRESSTNAVIGVYPKNIRRHSPAMTIAARTRTAQSAAQAQ